MSSSDSVNESKFSSPSNQLPDRKAGSALSSRPVWSRVTSRAANTAQRNPVWKNQSLSPQEVL
ncbi:hypothetical protein I79_026113 [Cricetulus griseus]|uniref:Uncharacterized protein n=1 Tax=Cricetulus griseus TaxID=10029 RepID=G3IQ25_CRIGR|nr:hypothetical protein I79_026113 [Cricetulus griseus]